MTEEELENEVFMGQDLGLDDIEQMFEETSEEDIDTEDAKNFKSEQVKEVKKGDFGNMNPEDA